MDPDSGFFMVGPSTPQIWKGSKLFRGPQGLSDSYFLHSFLVCVVFRSKVTTRRQLLCVEGLWGKRGRKMESESSGVTVSFVTLDKSLTYRVFLIMHQGHTQGLCFSACKE